MTLLERNIILTQIYYYDAEKTSIEKVQINREFGLYLCFVFHRGKILTEIKIFFNANDQTTLKMSSDLKFI